MAFRRNTLSRDGSVILRDVDLQIEDGERIVILGSSGAGKTTLLNELYRALAPRAALIPQPHGLVGPLSACQNIALGRIDQQPLWQNIRSLCRMPAHEKSDIATWAKRLDLTAQLTQSAHTLSGGQQSRVAIARALYRGGPIVLADEPCAALDPERSQQALNQLTQRFSTVICSMHNVEAGLQFATRVIGIADQRIAFDGLPTAISQQQLATLYSQNDHDQQPEHTLNISIPEPTSPVQRTCI